MGTWNSINTAVATVNSNGAVTAVSAGAVTITVTTQDGNKTANCTISVTQPVMGVNLNKTAHTLIVGATERLVAAIEPANATNQAVTWSSSVPTVATVSNDGLVTAVNAGVAVIIVTTQDGGKTATCTVTVSPLTSVETSDAPLARVYPNPTDGVFSLEFEAEGEYLVTLADMIGKALLRQTANGQRVQMDLSNYPAGAYLLTIEDGKRQSTMRVVKN